MAYHITCLCFRTGEETMSDILVLLEVLKRQLRYTEDDGMMYVADLAAEEIRKLRAEVKRLKEEKER